MSLTTLSTRKPALIDTVNDCTLELLKNPGKYLLSLSSKLTIGEFDWSLYFDAYCLVCVKPGSPENSDT